MSVRRYAENTTVSVDKSRGDISGILAAHGVERMAWGTGPEGDTLQFELDGHQFRFAIPKPTPDSMRADYGHEYAYPHNIDWRAKADQEWRRRWRAYVMLTKMKMEFVESGDSTLEREFMPYLLVDGVPLGTLLEEGRLPALTAG
jgi:hypothetical protein